MKYEIDYAKVEELIVFWKLKGLPYTAFGKRYDEVFLYSKDELRLMQRPMMGTQVMMGNEDAMEPTRDIVISIHKHYNRNYKTKGAYELTIHSELSNYPELAVPLVEMIK